MPRRLKVLVTGMGWVANGDLEKLSVCNFVKVDPVDFLSGEFDVSVLCEIGRQHYVKYKNNLPYGFAGFVNTPSEYELPERKAG